MFAIRHRSRWAATACTLPCCWPVRVLKVRVRKDRENGLWRWEIRPRRGRLIAGGSAFDFHAAVHNGLHAHAHLTEVLR